MRKGGCLGEDGHDDGREGRDLRDIWEVEERGMERGI